MKKIILLTFTAIAVIVISVGCKKSTTSTSPGTNEVFMQNTAFSPSSITVAVNTTIKWTNKDGMAHTVTSTSGLFDSGNISSGSTYSHQFTATGTYAYKCTIHSGMSGTVIVQ
ncbi:MAG TPA: cupredoxin domain-containing protein [Bacteroidia bacterium]